MVVFPNAKINLGLRITGKRPDGYHNLESIFYPVNWCDILEIVESNIFDFHPSGLPIEGNSQQNLVIRAYNLLREEFDLPPVNIYLHKVIPMGAGLGGGSADAAFTLKLLNDLFNLGLNEVALMARSELLGSDCPFFILNSPCHVSGRGEVIQKIAFDLSEKWIKLVYPGLHISTGNAFAQIARFSDANSIMAGSYDFSSLSEKCFLNDFEEGLCAKFPLLTNLREQLHAEGAEYVSMTGSGSTFYGIFSTEPEQKSIPGHTEFILKL